MVKARFYLKREECGNDYRPISWPIKYPYWLSGETDDDFIIVAYAEDKSQIMELWPEAYKFSFCDKVDEIEFSSRLKKPDWYNETE